MSEEIRAADATLTALHEAQQEIQRLLAENDVLLIELETARAIGRTLLAENDRLLRRDQQWAVKWDKTVETYSLVAALRAAWRERDAAGLEFNMLNSRHFEQGVQLGRCDAALELIIQSTSLPAIKRLARKLRKELQQEASDT